jgi:hypothetical protein
LKEKITELTEKCLNLTTGTTENMQAAINERPIQYEDFLIDNDRVDCDERWLSLADKLKAISDNQQKIDGE